MPGLPLVCDDWALERHWRKLCQHHADATLLDALHDAVGLHHQPGDKPDKTAMWIGNGRPNLMAHAFGAGLCRAEPLVCVAGAVRNARAMLTRQSDLPSRCWAWASG